jgi:hypothetical protein
MSRRAHIELAPLEERACDEGKFTLRPLVSVRNRTGLVVQSLPALVDTSVPQRLVRRLLLLFGLPDAEASRTVADMP